MEHSVQLLVPGGEKRSLHAILSSRYLVVPRNKCDCYFAARFCPTYMVCAFIAEKSAKESWLPFRMIDYLLAKWPWTRFKGRKRSFNSSYFEYPTNPSDAPFRLDCWNCCVSFSTVKKRISHCVLARRSSSVPFYKIVPQDKLWPRDCTISKTSLMRFSGNIPATSHWIRLIRWANTANTRQHT